ncbi:MAG: hypothetical protein HRU19_02265 [Pseudobacteriovorax sp.]|nr:hypothetical protein [Pseudobacteriovorax sp.]
MVQVDIFWSMAIGAGCAVSAIPKIVAETEEGVGGFWDGMKSPYFLATLLFVALVFAPSGTMLLWSFTSWETMHVGTRDLPIWLVGGFAITNVSQCILGFLLAYWWIKNAKYYKAYLLFFYGYLAMFFVLAHGWDGIGYKRFFSASKDQIGDWTWATAADWLLSPVAITLYVMGVFIIPTLYSFVYLWSAKPLKSLKPLAAFSSTIFVFALGSAVLFTICLNTFGYGSAFAIILYLYLLTNQAWGILPRVARGFYSEVGSFVTRSSPRSKRLELQS